MLIRVINPESSSWMKTVEMVKKLFDRHYQAQVNPQPHYFALIQDDAEHVLADR